MHHISYRQVFFLAIPIILANLTQPAMSAVDTAFAGHMSGSHHLAGVALGGVFFNLLFWGFGFLRMATTGLVAQGYGAGDTLSVLLTLIRGALLAIALGLCVLLLRHPLLALGLGALDASAAATSQAFLYAHGRVWSAPFTLFNYVVLGWLLGCQQVRLALLLQLLVNVINLIAIVGLVHGLGWGVEGIGVSTALADISGSAAGAWLIWRRYRLHIASVRWRDALTPAALQRLVQINGHIFVRTACLLAAMAWFTHLGAIQGDTLLAANAVLLSFLSFAAYGLDGFAHAAETLSGAAIGQRNLTRLTRVIRVCLVWGLIGAILYVLVYGVAGDYLIALLTDQPIIAETARHYLLWAILAPLISMPAYLFDGIFIGATRTRALMLVMLACSATFFVLSLILPAKWGNHGLWLSFLVFNGLRGAGLALALRPAVYRSLQA